MDSLFLFCLLFFCAFFCNDVQSRSHRHSHKGNDGKIVGGYDTTIQEYPYQVYLLLQNTDNKYYQCGGSIISEYYVLTAAHCLVGIKLVYVRIGSTNSEEGGIEYATARYKIHPLYNAKNSDRDVAVVNVASGMKIDGTNSRTIKLPDAGRQVEPGTQIVVSGWGTTSENGETSTTLMAVQVPTVSTEECRQSYGQSAITSRMFCAGLPEGGKDSCQGDSGGPAVDLSNNLQIGVVSFGIGCARPNYPGVYTNVSSVRLWIRMASGV